MKPDNNQLFGNIFDDKNITTTRLYNFGINADNKITAANTSKQYDAVLAALADPLLQLGIELGEVDTALAIQKGATLTNNQVLTTFKKTMSEQEPFILRAVGGKGTPAALEFFPHGLTEYSEATKTTMPMLTMRLNKAATKYATQLGTDLAPLLQAFENSWKTSRDTQQQQIGSVDGNRSDRDEVRIKAELALLFAIHTVSALNPGNITAGKALFDFPLLFAQTRHKHITLTGALAGSETHLLLNNTLKDTYTIDARNTDDNAVWCLYLGATATAPVPPDAIILQPGEHKNIVPSELGSLANTFLIIKNLSDVNAASYEIVVRGIEKEEAES